jgi:hypothetical protein
MRTGKRAAACAVRIGIGNGFAVALAIGAQGKEPAGGLFMNADGDCRTDSDTDPGGP